MNDSTNKTRYHLPETCTESYTASDLEKLAIIYSWLNADAKRSKSWLARATGLKDGTNSSVLSGKYNASPTEQLVQMIEATKRSDDRSLKGLDKTLFIETSVWKLTNAVCERAFTYRNFGILAGYVGTGKTTALKHYADNHSNVLLIEADPDMNAGVLLTDLLEAAGAVSSGKSIADKFRSLVKSLKGSDRLIIIDEAEKMMPRTLEYLRRIRDKAGIGIVLAGTERLSSLINREHGQFDQIRSRVGFWPQLIKGIKQDDAYQIIDANWERYWGDDSVTGDSVKSMCWRLCRGSCRLLAEDLIPAVRDYGLNRGNELTAELVKEVAKAALGLTPAREVPNK